MFFDHADEFSCGLRGFCVIVFGRYLPAVSKLKHHRAVKTAIGKLFDDRIKINAPFERDGMFVFFKIVIVNVQSDQPISEIRHDLSSVAEAVLVSAIEAKFAVGDDIHDTGEILIIMDVFKS